MTELQVDIKTATYRVVFQTPGHITYGFWINGGKMGELTCCVSERAAFTTMIERAGFKLTAGADRSHRLPPGECNYCDEQATNFHPPHDASAHCESGRHNHCTCDICF